MTTKTTLKIVTICIICAAIMMSGCMESDEQKSDIAAQTPGCMESDEQKSSADVESTDTDAFTDLESTDTESAADAQMPEPPLVVSLTVDPADLGESQYDPYLLKITLYENGTSEVRSIGAHPEWGERSTWDLSLESENSRSYDVDCGTIDMRVTLWDDGVATGAMVGIHSGGSWNSSISDDGAVIVPERNPTPARMPKPSATTKPALRLGETSKTLISEVTVLSAYTDDHYTWVVFEKERRTDAADGMMFVTTMVEMKNLATDSEYFGHHRLTMVDSDGNEYPSQMVAGDDGLEHIQSLIPGQEIRGKAFYEVPDDAKGLKIQFNDAYGLGDPEITSWIVD